MSYAIGYIFYGIDLMAESFSQFMEDLDCLRESNLGISHYSGGEMVLYLGVDLCKFNECNSKRTSEIKWQLPESERADADAEIFEQIELIVQDAQFSGEFKRFLVNQVPDTYLVWGSS